MRELCEQLWFGPDGGSSGQSLWKRLSGRPVRIGSTGSRKVNSGPADQPGNCCPVRTTGSTERSWATGDMDPVAPAVDSGNAVATSVNRNRRTGSLRTISKGGND